MTFTGGTILEECTSPGKRVLTYLKGCAQGGRALRGEGQWGPLIVKLLKKGERTKHTD